MDDFCNTPGVHLLEVSHLLSGEGVKTRPRLDAAMRWLDWRIRPGEEVPAGKIIAEACAAGHNRVTLMRARWRLLIDSWKARGAYPGHWVWWRPES